MEIEISQEDSGFMYKVIQKIIDEAGCRMPCSPQEAKGAEIIKAELEHTCDQVSIEPFTCHPRAFLGWIRVDICLMLISFLCFYGAIGNVFGEFSFILTLITFALNAVAFIFIFYEFFSYREFIDKLFRERSSQNVVGTIHAKGERKKIIIYAGHHDSALQFNLLRYLKFGYGVVLFLGLGVLFTWIIASVVFVGYTVWGLIAGSLDYALFADLTLGLFIVGIVPMIMLIEFVSSGEKANKVPGAVDNLSAVAIVLGVGRYLKKHRELIPDGTEIRLISFGCEEAGLRGAYRYAAEHRDELKAHHAEVVNMDCIQSIKNVRVVAYEPTTRTRHSEEVVNNVLHAAESMGIKAKLTGVTFGEKLIGQISGGSDAVPFSKAGIKATNLMHVDFKKFLQFYHQPTDRVDIISPGALEMALKICIAYLANKKEDQN